MLTGLELTFMGVTQSYSGLFSTPGFIVSPVGKRGMGAKKPQKTKNKQTKKQIKKTEGGKNGIEKESKEGSRNKERSEAR